MPLIIIGLGNPGNLYEKTRHNVGFHLVDGLARTFNVKLKKPFFKSYQIGRFFYKNEKIIIVKPLTYMNLSGSVLPHVFKRTHTTPGDMVVVCDNLDLDPGICRLKTKGSSGGQKGLASIIDVCGSENFKRIYIGIGRPPGGIPVVDHVLGIPPTGEEEAIQQGVETAMKGVLLLTSDSPGKVMGVINRKVSNG